MTTSDLLEKPFSYFISPSLLHNFVDSKMLVTENVTTTLLNWSDTIVKA